MSDYVPNWDLGFDINEFLSSPSEHDNRRTESTSSSSRANLPKVLDNVQNFIDAQKKSNTVNATKQHMKTLTNWLVKSKSEYRSIEELEPDLLNLYLQEFFISIKKLDGSDYEPASLDAMKAAFDRHLRDKGYEKSIVVDAIFFKTRQAHTARKLAVKKNRTGAKTSCSGEN